ncbi:hypothetical protein [Bosea sp. PAMC 26642]|uniref:hypothetical protein n=1 Tax=Bosea sp. (strain PAMC 26642) TaxID=1792307 RepID=UPI000770118C|nr:hypothetical protein [Bosea sp. PAMC 26642]AMJ60176.1 hypothetical protein AXW83_07585 [Bosea sp. PAMC 26642]
MPKTMVAALIGAGLLILLPGPSQAFWQRGQLSACSDATSELERIRLRCWELDPYATTLPSPVGLDGGLRDRPFGHRSGAGAPYRGPVARRLG